MKVRKAEAAKQQKAQEHIDAAVAIDKATDLLSVIPATCISGIDILSGPDVSGLLRILDGWRERQLEIAQEILDAGV